MGESVLAIGPYIGDFEQEIVTFRPFARWHSKVVGADNTYVSTHYNRSFLYDWLPTENILPVYENLTRDEINQHGYIHITLQQKDFSLLVRKFKNDIVEIHKCTKSSINMYNLSYIKSTPVYSIFKKIFEPINVNSVDVKGGDVVFIPSDSDNEERLEHIYDYLHSTYNTIVVGDMKTYLQDKNVILKYIDYFENGYKYIIKHILKAKAVFCPLGHWTTICNLQNIPVLSWGEPVSQYKPGGIYNFGNKKCMVIALGKDEPFQHIKSMIEYFMEAL